MLGPPELPWVHGAGAAQVFGAQIFIWCPGIYLFGALVFGAQVFITLVPTRLFGAQVLGAHAFIWYPGVDLVPG